MPENIKDRVLGLSLFSARETEVQTGEVWGGEVCAPSLTKASRDIAVALPDPNTHRHKEI